ncbi:MAG: hypothetical protein ACSLEY_01440 [Candidatus Saccharimonadales bacterium]
MRAHLKKMTHSLSPFRISSHYNAKKIFQTFAENTGLVYFGYVGTADEYEGQPVIRGVTVSVNHRDAHYCVGRYDNYDVTFVERTDMLKSSLTTPSVSHLWHILEINLHTSQDLPHVFVGRHTHTEGFYRQLFTKFPALRSIRLGTIEAYSGQFLSMYRVYTRPTNTVEVEKLLTPLITDMMSKHFGDLAFEIAHKSLFIYSEGNQLRHALLEAMLKNGVWLAKQIDEPYQTE